MSEYFGTLTQRPVHPASPVLLLYVTKDTLPHEHFLSVAYILCFGPRVAALIPCSRLTSGNSTSLKLSLSPLRAQQTRPTPFRTLPRTVAELLSRIGIVQFVYLEVPRTRLCCRSSTLLSTTALKVLSPAIEPLSSRQK